MTLDTVLYTLNRELIRQAAALDAWFDHPEDWLSFRPADHTWTPAEILEHVSLTNHFLLLIIRKAADKALRRAAFGRWSFDPDYTLSTAALDAVGVHQSFRWIRPEHMEPRGEMSLAEVRVRLRQQLEEALTILDSLSSGAGVLQTTTMTVNNLGRLDVYQYLYFLAMHGKRHAAQLEKLIHTYAMQDETV